MTSWAAFWTFLAICAMCSARNARQSTTEDHEYRMMVIREEIDATRCARLAGIVPDNAQKH